MNLALALVLLAPPFIVSPSERGVVLRWAWDEGPRPTGYFVERRDGGPWTRLTTQPLTRLRDRNAARARLGDRYDRYAPLLFPDDPRAEHADPESIRGLLLLAADAEPAVARVLGLRYDDESARAGTSYEYRLVALTAEGERVLATSARVVAGRYTAPAGPDSLRAVQRAGGVGLRWTALGQASGYHVYRGARRDGAGARRLNDAPVVILQGEGPIAIQAPTFFSDTTALARDTVFYWVEWIDAFGRASRRSQPGALVPRDLTAPLPPAVVQTRLAGDTVVVTWRKPEGDVAAYQVWRGEAAGGPFVKVGQPVPGAALELRDPGRPARRISWYRVTSVDRAGREGDPSPVALAEVRDLTPPGPPSGLSGAADTGRLSLRWSAVAAPDLRGYRVYRASTPDGSFGLLSATPQRDTTFRDPVPRQADHPYFYRVTAVDSAFNESAPSASLALRPPDVVPPSAPRIVAVRGTRGGLRVEWLPNPEPDVVSYRIRYRVAGARAGAWLEAPTPAPAAAQRDSLGGLEANRRYEVSLVAVDDAGNRSAPAKPVSGATPRSADARAPELRRVAYDRAARAVVVEWTPVTSAVLILRKEAADTAFRPVGSVQPGVTRFADRLVRAGRTYEYRVGVRDGQGNPLHSRVRQVVIP